MLKSNKILKIIFLKRSSKEEKENQEETMITENMIDKMIIMAMRDGIENLVTINLENKDIKDKIDSLEKRNLKTTDHIDRIDSQERTENQDNKEKPNKIDILIRIDVLEKKEERIEDQEITKKKDKENLK
jgi:hypothetical protein